MAGTSPVDETNLLQARGYLIEMLGKELRQGDFSLKQLPKVLNRILKEQSWKEFETQLGHVVRHDCFDEFIVKAPFEGLGSTVELVEKIVSVDNETLTLFQHARKRPAGRPKKQTIEDDQQEIGLYYKPITKGTHSAYGLTVLEKHEPELYAEAIAGTTSIHAALVATGHRKPYVSVRVDDPASAARTLRKKLTVEQRHELARLLLEEH